MKIIIAGLGQTGLLFAELVCRESHDVTVIDNDREAVEAATDRLNVSGICGSGASKSVLLRAGAATADIVIALTPSDETNFLCCMIAKKCGTRYTAARIHREEFTTDLQYFMSEFNIDYIFNPRHDTATEISRHIGLPGTVKADAFFSSAATIIELTAVKASSLIGLTMKEIKSSFAVEMLISTVTRDGKIHIPSGDFKVEQNDIIGIIAPDTSFPSIFSKLGILRKSVKHVLIVGGGTTAKYLMTELTKKKKSFTVIDCDRKRCTELSSEFPTENIIFGNGIDTKTLLDEGLKKADVCVSLTGKDETNLVISMFAWSNDVKSVITRIGSPSYEKLLKKVNIDITISPAVISVERLMGFVRNIAVYNREGNDINRLYRIADGLAEAIEFIAYDNCTMKDIQFKSPQFRLRKNVIIGAIIRGDSVVVPDGQSCIKQGDHVIVIADKTNKFNTLNDIFG